MNDNNNEFQALQDIFLKAYNQGTSLEEAERLAARFLTAQMNVAVELEAMDLDTRAKKAGLKAIKAAVYMECVKGSDKKPAEGYLDHYVTLDKTVCDAQDRFDEADARKESLSLFFGIFKDAHIYFRGIAKGSFNG